MKVLWTQHYVEKRFAGVRLLERARNNKRFLVLSLVFILIGSFFSTVAYGEETFLLRVGAYPDAVAVLFAVFVLVIVISRIQVRKKTKELKINNEALRESEERYRLLIYRIPSAVVVCDADAKIIDSNPKAQKLLGVTKDQMLGKAGLDPGLKFISDEGERLSPKMYPTNRVLTTQQPLRNLTAGIYRPDKGSVVWVLVNADPVLDDNGKIKQVLVTFMDITDRKIIEEKLVDEQKRLRTILDVSPIGIGLVVDRKLEWANTAMYSMVGCEEGSLMGKSARILYSDREEYERVGREFNACTEKHKTCEVKTVWIRKDGSLFDCVLRMNSLYPANPSRGQIVTVTDISELHLANKELQKSEERYRSVFENTGTANVIIEEDSTISMVNAGFEKLCGLPRGEIEGKKKWAEYVFEQDLERMKEYAAERKNGRFNAPSEYTFRFIDIHLNIKDILVKVDLIPGTGKRIAALTDITPLKLAEEAMRQSEEKYRRFFETSKDVVYITSADGEFLDMNDAGLNLFGIKRDELHKIKAAWDIYAHPADREAFTESLREDGYVTSYEVDLKMMDGTIFPATITAVSVKDSDGNIKAYQGIIRDETERKRLEIQLIHAQKMEAIGTLAGGIAHDFNNLLTAVQGNTSLMLIHHAPGDEEYTRLKNIEQCVDSGSALTRQLLGFARSGTYDVRPMDLGDLVDRTAEMFGRTKKEISIHTSFAEDLWPVEADSTQIEQVLLNLYVNAWQAMPAGGDLYLQTENVELDEDYVRVYETIPGRYAKLSVTDTGVGMEESIKSRIFEPFFTTKEMGRGTGLGLASAYGIVRYHKGIINVYSEKDHGTTFSIYLPASDTAVQNYAISEKKVQHGEGTILLVDDEEIIIDVGLSMLKSFGYKVLTAANGQEAVDIYRENMESIDLVILDMIMPNLGGAETFDILREINPDIKVILSSGYSANGKASAILKRGCSSFIQKPFDMKTLSINIRQVLE